MCGPHGLPQLEAACAFGSTLLRLQCALQGNCPKRTLRLVHFPGLSCSGSRVLRKGTDGWVCVLCPSQVRTAQATRGLASALSPVERASESPPCPGCSGPACPGRALSQLCPVSPLGRRSAAALPADVNLPGPRRTWLATGSLHKQLGGGCRTRGPDWSRPLPSDSGCRACGCAPVAGRGPDAAPASPALVFAPSLALRAGQAAGQSLSWESPRFFFALWRPHSLDRSLTLAASDCPQGIQALSLP